MKKYILFAAAALSLAACNNDNDNIIDEPVAARISASIGNSAVSRASDQQWAEGDAIGITMDDRYVNIKYTTDAGDGIFTGETIYFRNKREPVSLSAYYPFTATESMSDYIIEASTSAEFQTSELQPTFDFMHAALENVTGASPAVKFDFAHKMCKLTLQFKNDETNTQKDVVSLITSFSIEGLKHEGTFNTRSGECVAKSAVAAEPIEFSFGEGKVNDVEPLILFPQTVTSVTLKLSDSENQDYACELKFPDNQLKSGDSYHFSITVKKTELSISHEITPWVAKDIEGEASSDDYDD